MAREGVLRRSDQDEMLAYEYWEPDASWFSAAVSIFPKQQLGLRFRPLVHTPAEEIVDAEGDEQGEVIPFDPPPPPPQPQGTPRTQPLKPRPAKPKKPSKPAEPKPDAPPVPGTGPKTGGG